MLQKSAPRLAVTAMAALGGLTFLSAAPAGASKPVTVKAVETDFHISLSKKSFSPGTYTFVTQNKGQTTHALMITGPGIKNAMTSNIAPGKSAKLTVTLKKGKYDIYCPVPGHKGLGMNVNLTVGAKSSSSTSKASSNASTGGSSGGYGY